MDAGRYNVQGCENDEYRGVKRGHMNGVMEYLASREDRIELLREEGKRRHDKIDG
jgi:hypothetical protein